MQCRGYARRKLAWNGATEKWRSSRTCKFGNFQLEERLAWEDSGLNFYSVLPTCDLCLERSYSVSLIIMIGDSLSYCFTHLSWVMKKIKGSKDSGCLQPSLLPKASGFRLFKRIEAFLRDQWGVLGRLFCEGTSRILFVRFRKSTYGLVKLNLNCR